MKHFSTIFRRTLALVMLLVASQACSVYNFYKFNGASLDYNVYKTVSFSDFPIRAALVYPPLQQTFENKLRDMVAQNTRLRVIDSPNSDLRMEGEITLSNDQRFSAYRDFDSSQMLTDVQDDLCAQICNDLKDLIFNATFGNW